MIKGVLIISFVAIYCVCMAGMIVAGVMEKNMEEYKLKGVGETFTVTKLDDDTKTELEKFGKLYSYFQSNLMIYHLVIHTPLTNTRTIISFVKGLYSYGYDKDLWEASIIQREKKQGKADVRAVLGNLNNQELIDFVTFMAGRLQEDPSWFASLPREIKKV